MSSGSQTTVVHSSAFAAVTGARELARALPVDEAAARAVAKHYPIRISRHFLSLVRDPSDPLGLQVVPHLDELDGPDRPDPLSEEDQSPAPGLVHRYPDRALLLMETRCAVRCRYCLRKRLWDKTGAPDLSRAMAYIAKTPAIREVILSGGDPMMAPRERLIQVLASLKAIPHVKVLRIHTRVPLAEPSRITPGLARDLARFHPLYINIQANHPDELSPEGARALSLLADAGIPLGSQTVLLKGVNDDPRVLAGLFHALLELRVKPYYLHHLDRVSGTAHFHVGLARGLELYGGLAGLAGGPALPRYVLDLPGGRGKVPLTKDSVTKIDPNTFELKTPAGKIETYVEE